MADQVKYTQKLKGDKVLIIGGSSGIGYAVAEAVIEYGGTIIISSSSEQKVAKKVAELQSSYPSAKDRISGHACDLGDEHVEANLKSLLDKSGTLDHIVFTAGDALAIKQLSEVDLDFIKKAGQVRFFAPILLGKLAPKYLKPGPKASITLTTGAIAERPSPAWTVVGFYATGLLGVARQLAIDLKPIRVNIVSPGAVDTELWDHGLNEEQKQGMLAGVAKTLPTGKVGSPLDLAESYIYLLRDHNITGSTISTNGGALLVGPS